MTSNCVKSNVNGRTNHRLSSPRLCWNRWNMWSVFKYLIELCRIHCCGLPCLLSPKKFSWLIFDSRMLRIVFLFSLNERFALLTALWHRKRNDYVCHLLIWLPCWIIRRALNGLSCMACFEKAFVFAWILYCAEMDSICLAMIPLATYIYRVDLLPRTLEISFRISLNRRCFLLYPMVDMELLVWTRTNSYERIGDWLVYSNARISHG